MIQIWGVWLLYVVAIVLLVMVSAFLSGSETALTAASRPRILQRLQDGDERAEATLFLMDHYDVLISVLLFGNNVVNILASALATSIFIGLYGDIGVAVATAVMTVVILLFAEVAPKTYASAHPEYCALGISRLWMRLLPLFFPVTILVNRLVSSLFLVLRIDALPAQGSAHHIEELRGAIMQHDNSEDTDSAQESDMMRSILDLDDIDVSEVMTHRSEVAMLDLDRSVADNLDTMMECPFSRLPLYRDDAEDIVGVLHAKKLLPLLKNADFECINLVQLANLPWFIPENTSLLEQLQAFRRRREHFAIVVDEYGGFSGVVTLEDILEVIVGDIDDESDTLQPGIQLNVDGSYSVPGTTTIRNLNRELELNLPDGENYSTLAGLLLHRAKSIPEEGQSFLVAGLRIDVVERVDNQLTRLIVHAEETDHAA
ncbi:MAG: HlyC/CorC family transporter [Alphaproteobacteria bacterium]|nr:HlyC/CorC family transporter [Alphaproteobacteria bacterium]